MIFVIEHLDVLSKWILAEYKHSYEIAKNEKVDLLITGVKIEGLPSTEKRFYEIFNPENVIILDPQAEEELKPNDKAEAIIIGGILGDHPLRGRTKTLLSDIFPKAKKRNIGKLQFPIDGALYVAIQIMKGKRLSEIPIVFGLSIITNFKGLEEEIYLPFAYPLVNGSPLISEEVIKYLVGNRNYRLKWGGKEEEIEFNYQGQSFLSR
ncbi:hypothetical protein SJAV_17370 [Sulfurisphaera javensis]|uniref:SAM-dependent methyltransferase n=1 Tax=Sulfurisphaera javensis TaxID=2049879 RepID=A0AAT9GSL0_9CREN